LYFIHLAKKKIRDTAEFLSLRHCRLYFIK